MPEGARGWGAEMIAYLPMTKGAVKGMDTIETFMEEHEGHTIDQGTKSEKFIFSVSDRKNWRFLYLPNRKFAGITFRSEIQIFSVPISIPAIDAFFVAGGSKRGWTTWFVGVCEAAHMSVVVPRLDGDWGDYEPGNYGLDPWGRLGA